jgi:Flp pilus assembly pilin Flp
MALLAVAMVLLGVCIPAGLDRLFTEATEIILG